MSGSSSRSTGAASIALDDERVFFTACGRCDGSGEVGASFTSRDDPYAMETCPECNGSGVVEGEPDLIEEEDFWEWAQ